MGDEYTVADIAIFPMVRNLLRYYKAGDLVGIGDYPEVTRVLDAFLARAAVKKGLKIP
jgi:GST-like protein